MIAPVLKAATLAVSGQWCLFQAGHFRVWAIKSPMTPRYQAGRSGDALRSGSSAKGRVDEREDDHSLALTDD